MGQNHAEGGRGVMKVSGKTVRRCLAALLVLCLVIWFMAGRWKQSSAEETAIPDDRLAVQAAAVLEGRYACLTFDDGPSENTAAILEILARYQAHATFFVTAQPINEPYFNQLPLIQTGGHQIALHSASHRYADIYKSSTAFWLDIKQLRQTLSAWVDVDQIHWLRFPGGSTNTISHRYGGSGIMKELVAQAEEKGYYWIDWNVCAEDATSSHPDAVAILQNIQKDAEGRDVCVVLMHDTAATGETVKALPRILDWFSQQGYEFCTVEQMYTMTKKE